MTRFTSEFHSGANSISTEQPDQTPEQKPKTPKYNLQNLHPPFQKGNHFAKQGGRPRLSEAVKQDRRDARQILRDAGPSMAARIVELSQNMDPDIAIKAIKVGIDKILPNLEEVETHDDRPLFGFVEAQLESKLAIIRASHNGRPSRNGDSEGNGVAS